jgi:hypothetical protein
MGTERTQNFIRASVFNDNSTDALCIGQLRVSDTLPGPTQEF